MRPPEVSKYLFDIWQACELLVQFTTGKTLDADVANQVSDSGRIVAFRNRLIHAYAAVSNEVVWGIIEAYLPKLRLEIRQLLETAG